MKRSLFAGLMAGVLPGTSMLPCMATAAQETNAAPKPAQAAIPFANLKFSIRDWDANGRDGIWVQDVRRDWYYASFLNPCFGLDFASRVAFVTPGDRLDRFSSIIVEDEPVRCVFDSFTKSDAPPPKKERDAARKAAAQAAKEAKAGKPAG